MGRSLGRPDGESAACLQATRSARRRLVFESVNYDAAVLGTLPLFGALVSSLFGI